MIFWYITGKILDEHIENLRMVFDCLLKPGLRLNPGKRTADTKIHIVAVNTKEATTNCDVIQAQKIKRKHANLSIF